MIIIIRINRPGGIIANLRGGELIVRRCFVSPRETSHTDIASFHYSHVLH